MHLHAHAHHALIALCGALVVAASGSHAAPKARGWQFIGEFESGMVQYIDMDTLRKERGYVRVRTLVDHKKPVRSVTSKQIFSELDEQYVDCKARKSALLKAAAYECRMAKCAPKENFSYGNEPLEFKPVPVNESLASNLFSLVCQ
jgi:hypothetical protein